MRDIAFFLHIPRTAGTTLNSILRNNFAPGEIISVYEKDDYALHASHSAEELKNIRLIQGHLLLQRYDPPVMYGQPVRVFTFLREPLDRLLSEYAFLRSWPANHLYRYLNDNTVSFKEYIESREKQLFYRGKNFMTRCISGMDDSKPYPVRALARAKMHLEKSFGFVGIQERFMESLVLLGDYLGLNNLLHEKRNVLKKNELQEIPHEELAIAKEYNQGDVELYKFACQLFEDRVQARGKEFTDQVRKLEFLNAKFQKISNLLMKQSDTEDKGAILLPKDGKWK